MEPNPEVELVPAGREQEPILANLLELYSHDFSEFVDLELGPDGRFGYVQLPLYWQEQNRYPFLIQVDGHIAGLAFVTQKSRLTGDPSVYDMSEFFVARKYRKRGVGTLIAEQMWQRFPGPWEVRVLKNNLPAAAFWRFAISKFTRSVAAERLVLLEDKDWRVFSFKAGSCDDT